MVKSGDLAECAQLGKDRQVGLACIERRHDPLRQTGSLIASRSLVLNHAESVV